MSHETNHQITPVHKAQFRNLHNNFFNEVRELGKKFQALEDENNIDREKINRQILEDSLTDLSEFQSQNILPRMK